VYGQSNDSENRTAGINSHLLRDSKLECRNPRRRNDHRGGAVKTLPKVQAAVSVTFSQIVQTSATDSARRTEKS